ncbi:MAG: hypothetical protein LBI05_10325 [Planctomycetaceae bacterium]|nr:hypothetical protein [Planctomycetaceae bacterium]
MFLAGEPECEWRAVSDEERDIPDYPRQVRNLLENVKAVCEKQGFTGDNVATMCHFFIADIGMKELVRQLAHEIFPQILDGAVTVVPQAPASGAVIALELWGIGGDPSAESPVICDTSVPGRFVLAEFDKMRWFFGGGFQPAPQPIGAYERSFNAFEQFRIRLEATRFSRDQLLRTWIYQGHLVSEEGKTQRYKELNRARTDFFSETQFLKQYLPKEFKGIAYPASTGIGADGFDVVVSAVALDTQRKDVMVVPLENPNQTSAFDYDAAYSPQSPKFSRAMATAVDKECLIFVSGTASITDSESQHIGDPVKQTEQTLDNIAALIDGGNLARHGIKDMPCGLGNLVSARVYVKRPKDVEAVRQVCQQRLPEVPTIYTIADVCRPELLVEIEGVALAR